MPSVPAQNAGSSSSGNRDIARSEKSSRENREFVMENWPQVVMAYVAIKAARWGYNRMAPYKRKHSAPANKQGFRKKIRRKGPGFGRPRSSLQYRKANDIEKKFVNLHDLRTIVLSQGATQTTGVISLSSLTACPGWNRLEALWTSFRVHKIKVEFFTTDFQQLIMTYVSNIDQTNVTDVDTFVRQSSNYFHDPRTGNNKCTRTLRLIDAGCAASWRDFIPMTQVVTQINGNPSAQPDPVDPLKMAGIKYAIRPQFIPSLGPGSFGDKLQIKVTFTLEMHGLTDTVPGVDD